MACTRKSSSCFVFPWTEIRSDVQGTVALPVSLDCHGASVVTDRRRVDLQQVLAISTSSVYYTGYIIGLYSRAVTRSRRNSCGRRQWCQIPQTLSVIFLLWVYLIRCRYCRRVFIYATWLISWMFRNISAGYALLLMLPFFVFLLCAYTRLVRGLFLTLHRPSATPSLAKLCHQTHSHLSNYL